MIITDDPHLITVIDKDNTCSYLPISININTDVWMIVAAFAAMVLLCILFASFHICAYLCGILWKGVPHIIIITLPIRATYHNNNTPYQSHISQSQHSLSELHITITTLPFGREQSPVLNFCNLTRTYKVPFIQCYSHTYI